MKKERPSKKEISEIIDIIKKNLVYQTPRPIFIDKSDAEPHSVSVTILTSHYKRLLEIANNVKGWVLPSDAREQIEIRHNALAARAYETGDLSPLRYGDLAKMYSELDNISEMSEFREKIRAEINKRYGNES